MTPDAFLSLLRTHWPMTLAALDGDRRARLRDGLNDLAAAGDRKAVERALRTLRLQLRSLPPDHPVARELSGTVRYADAPPAPTVDRALLGELLDVFADPPPGPAELLRAAHERLWRTPALGPAELAPETADDPAAAGLIRLTHPGSGDRYPRFQFAPGTTEPLPVVRRINHILMADKDPWGAADWWLGGNGRLAGIPAELLGEVPDEDLARAALELVAGC
ncbi:hypothetical protein OOK39_18975 [Streptomyces sp. NBC_00264]|uniref:hypothetical protein n=1 Tax=unclassified Streptomyces TaxID=2593676 RepID=UPI002253E026|nr:MULTISPECIES: hypothetical protein [unclassified Streptomyces]MCX5161345.1 hypothetical protein [Streptomyces sp. NBC_00305]MCX5219868.1 hypothetical protein [Streptomyces sp. NBC_00264]WSC29144.1 hypothetical protein OG902_21975 [Streptomyces sp. NBC_01768]